MPVSRQNLVRKFGGRRLLDFYQWQTTRLRQELTAMGYHLWDSVSPIQPVMIGDAAQAMAYSDALLKRGLLVTAIRPPTVPKHTARLRVTLSASHTNQQLDQLLQAFYDLRHLDRSYHGA